MSETDGGMERAAAVYERLCERKRERGGLARDDLSPRLWHRQVFLVSRTQREHPVVFFGWC